MTAPASAPALTTADLLAKLRFRFSWPEYALLEEVGFGGDGRFTDRTTIADAVAIGQWYSKGYGLHGFEIKSSRGDWLREVRTIGKADAAYRYCVRFWLIAPEGVATLEELPGTWGWMVPHGQTLRVKRQGPLLTPDPLPPGAIAHLVGVSIRRGSRDGEGARRENEAYQRGLLEGTLAEQQKYRPEELDRIRRVADRLEEAAGIKLEDWTPTDEMGKAIRFVMNGGMKKMLERAGSLATSHLEALQALGLVVDEIEPRRYGSAKTSIRRMLAAAGVEPNVGSDHW